MNVNKFEKDFVFNFGGYVNYLIFWINLLLNGGG